MRAWNSSVIVGALLLLGSLACAAPPTGGPDLEVEEYDVPAGNVSIYARRVGGSENGSTAVVLIHGGPGWSSEYLRGLQNELARPDLPVVIYDQRGCGQSSAPLNSVNSYQMNLYAGDLESVRLAVGADTLHLVAHDFGLVVAMGYVASFGGRAVSLATFGGAPPTDLDFDDARLELQSHIEQLQGTGQIPDPVPTTQGNDCSPPLLATLPAYYANPDFGGGKLTDALTCSNQVVENTHGATDGYDLSADMAAFSRPTLVMYGSGDGFGSTMGQQTASAFGETLDEVSDCGHFWQECNDEVASRLKDFLP